MPRGPSIPKTPLDRPEVGVLQIDADFNLSGLNPAAGAITGFSPEQALGEPCEEILRCDQCGPDCPLRRARDQGSPQGPLLSQAYNRNREPKSISLLSIALKNSQGRFLGGVEIVQDLTTMHAEAQERSLLVSGLIHDLKTPLVGIRGFTGLLLKNLDKLPPLEAREHLDMIARQVGRLENLMNGLQTALRPDVNGLELRPEPINLLRLMERLAAGRAARFQRAGVELLLHSSPDLPVIQADAALLRRGLANLLDHALARCSQGGTVTVSASWDEHQMSIRVSDTGPAITPEQLAGLFQPFCPEPGLAGVKAIVEAHSGGITAQSRPSGGTAWEITLPLAEPGTGLHTTEQALK